MRIVYVDIDCLRPDHLGCYGYHRPTSPHIDALAAEGLRFTNVYASDVPCLPSRTAMFSGRFGVHTGVANHGGARAEMYSDGEARGFSSRLTRTSFMRCLRDQGYTTATVSSFGERHAALHFYANFNEIINPGRRGLESGEVVGALAEDWLARRGHEPNWFLHVHLWDPHTPYRAPAALGEPFANTPPPAWLTEAVRARDFAACGPHGAQDTIGFSNAPPPELAWNYPRQPTTIDSTAAVRAMFDGYDAGVLHADAQVGRLRQKIVDMGLGDDVVWIVTGDHGENLGELNVYGDHQTADEMTCHVPFLLAWPGITDTRAGQTASALHYQFDLAATIVELAGGAVPSNWDGRSGATALREGRDEGRHALVLSQGAWTCQRSVRFRVGGGEYLLIRTYHDGYHLYPDLALFDLGADPHEQFDLAALRPDLVAEGSRILEAWGAETLGQMDPETNGPVGDPFWTILREGGPYHVRRDLPAYLERLRATGRGAAADALAAKHPRASRR